MAVDLNQGVKLGETATQPQLVEVLAATQQLMLLLKQQIGQLVRTLDAQFQYRVQVDLGRSPQEAIEIMGLTVLEGETA